MAELYEIKKDAERVILVGVQMSEQDDTAESLCAGAWCRVGQFSLDAGRGC